MADDATERLERLNRSILAIVKDAMQRVPEELSAYVLQNMTIGEQPRKTQLGNRRFDKPNTSNRLRTLYGNLTRAVQPGGPGNIARVEVNGANIIEASLGIAEDTKVRQGKRTGDLRYWRIHEYGGTVNSPGGTPYMVIKGEARFVSNATAAKYAARGRQLKRTKPHTIRIQARPFLEPGLQQYLNDPAGYRGLIDKIETDIIDALT